MNFMVFVLSILHRNPHYTSSLSFLSWSKLHRYLLTDLKIKNEMANETTYQSGPNVLHWNVLLWNFCIKYTLINTRDLLPLSACCNCSPYAQTLPPPEGFLYLISVTICFDAVHWPKHGCCSGFWKCELIPCRSTLSWPPCAFWEA